MARLSLDDDLRRDYEAGFQLAQNSEDDAFFQQFAKPAEGNELGDGGNAPAAGDAGAPAAAKPAAAPSAPAAGAPVGGAPAASADPIAGLREQAKALHEKRGSIGPGVGDIFGGLMESAPQIVGGVLDAMNEAGNALESLNKPGEGLALLDKQVSLPGAAEGDFLPTTDSADTMTGGLIRSTAQFLTGFIPAMKAAKGLSFGSKVLQSFEAGALADLVVFDPHEARLSTWLNTVPALAPIVPDYLADNNPEHEGEWEGRFKNAIEGAGLGVFAEGLVKTFKYYKAARAATAEARRLAMTPTDLGAVAAKDAETQAAVADLVNPVPPEALDGLGDPAGDLIVTSDAATMADAMTTKRAADARIAEAGARVERVGVLDRILESVRTRNETAAAAGISAPDALEDFMNMARTGVVGAEPAAKFKRFPLVGLIKGQGGVKPGSPLAQELIARGVTSRKMPGLFRKTGKGAFDNIVASEHGLDDLADPSTGYIDPDKFFEALDEELAGNIRLPPDVQEAQFQFEGLNRDVDLFRNDLEQLGVDFDTMDNAAIRRRLDEVDAERDRLADMEATPRATSEGEFGGLDADEGVGAPRGQSAPADLSSPGVAGRAAKNSDNLAPPAFQAAPDQVSTLPEPSGSATTRPITPPSSTEGGVTTFTELRLGILDLDNKKILQGTADFKALLAGATEQLPIFVNDLNRIVSGIPGARFGGARVKTSEGIEGKIAIGRPAETINDYLGGRIVVETQADLESVRRALADQHRILIDNNFILGPTGWNGYRANHVQVDLGNGMSAEVQILPSAIFDVQDQAHKIYDTFKRLDPANLSADDLLRYRQAEKDVAAIFDERWDEARFLARSAAPPKIFINHARINTPDDVHALLQQAADSDADAINVKRRGVVTNEQTRREAAGEFQNLEDLIGRAPGPMSASEAVAARKVLTASGEQLLALAKKAAADGATPADLFAFRRATQVHYAIQSEVIAARTETARALQSWAMPAGNDKMRADQIAELLTQGGGKDTVTMAKMIGTLADNPAGLNAFVQRSMRGKVGAALFEAWINGLLSSPKTHLVNMTSNALTMFWQIPERMLAAGISNAFYGGEVAFGEAAASAYGMAKGFRDGVKLIARGADDPDVAQLFEAFSKQERPYGVAIASEAFDISKSSPLGFTLDYMGRAMRLPGQALSALGAPGSAGDRMRRIGGALQPSGDALDIAGKAIRLPGTLLDYEDKMFKAINYRMELHALAFRQASQEGLEGKQLGQRMADLISNPPDTIKLEAIDRAHINTFTKKLGPLGGQITGVINRIPGARLVIPFIRTPTNILKYTFSRTPLAFASQAIRADIAAGGARAASAYARVGMGSMVMLTIADMAAEGTITGAGPNDPTLRAGKQRTGWKPYTVRVGDRYFTYNRLEPIGMLFGMAADIAEIMGHVGEEEASKVVAAAAVAFAQNMASKTWAQGVFEALAAIDPNNPVSDPGKWGIDFTGSTLPFSSFLRNLTAATDPVLREPRTSDQDEFAQDYLGDLPKPVAEFLTLMINQYRKNIPGLSDDLPARRDLWGRPISVTAGLGWLYDFLSPIGGAPANDDPVDMLMTENRIKVAMPERSIGGVKLTGEEYQAFVELAGVPAKKYLDKLVSSPGFKNMSGGPDGLQATMIKSIISHYRGSYGEQKSGAAAMMMMKFPALRKRYQENQRRKATRLLGAE